MVLQYVYFFTEKYEPDPSKPEECESYFPVSKEYKPVCMLDSTDPVNKFTQDYNNFAEMSRDMYCHKKKLSVLSLSKCESKYI